MSRVSSRVYSLPAKTSDHYVEVAVKVKIATNSWRKQHKRHDLRRRSQPCAPTAAKRLGQTFFFFFSVAVPRRNKRLRPELDPQFLFFSVLPFVREEGME